MLAQLHTIIRRYRFRLPVMLLLAFWLSFEPILAFAAVPDEAIVEIYNKNGIYFYNPAGVADSCNNSATTLSGDNLEEKIWNYFISQGFNDVETAGIMGNGMGESGLHPTVQSGKYFGIFQWGPLAPELKKLTRDAGLGKYIDEPKYWRADYTNSDKDIPEADIDKMAQIQLDFLMDRNDWNWIEKIKGSPTPEYAAEVFLVEFERAYGNSITSDPIEFYAPYIGKGYQGAVPRKKFAREFYDKYSGKGVSVKGGNSGHIENGKNITIIGDSISAGAYRNYFNKFTELSPNNIDAVSGRTWEEGMRILKERANNGSLNTIVVFELGSNSPGLTTSQIDEAIRVVGDSRYIVFITNYDGRSTYDTNNQRFKEAATKNSNVIIADWVETVSKSPELYLYKDHVHPNEAGSNLFVEMVYDAVNSNTDALGCSVSGEFQSLVLDYAWPDFHPAPYLERRPGYADAVTRSIAEGRYVGGSVGGVPGIDCGGFVTVLVQNSNVDPKYNEGGGNTYTQEAYVKSHGWTALNNEGAQQIDTSILRAGDVAFTPGHTFIYVGEIPGFNNVIASASYSSNGISSGRAPMAGHENLLTGKGANVRWWRNPNYSNQTTSFSGSAGNSLTGKFSLHSPDNASLTDGHITAFFNDNNSPSGSYLPGQAVSNKYPVGTVLYVQTSATSNGSYAHGKYFYVAKAGTFDTKSYRFAENVDSDRAADLAIYHPNQSTDLLSYNPYSTNQNSNIYVVEKNMSWNAFKSKYGW